MKNSISLIFLLCVVMNVNGQVPNPDDKVTLRDCHHDIYIEVASIAAATGSVAWIDCDEEEPAFSDNLWRSTNGDYSITKLTRTVRYNSGLFEPEYFWFRGACAGDEICIDNAITDHVAPGGTRMIVPNVNTCWDDNGVWMDFCTQCQDCNDDALPPTGRWWKYQRTFLENELEAFKSSSNPLQMDLAYQMLVDCEWEVQYGCEDGELQ